MPARAGVARQRERGACQRVAESARKQAGLERMFDGLRSDGVCGNPASGGRAARDADVPTLSRGERERPEVGPAPTPSAFVDGQPVPARDGVDAERKSLERIAAPLSARVG